MRNFSYSHLFTHSIIYQCQYDFVDIYVILYIIIQNHVNVVYQNYTIIIVGCFCFSSKYFLNFWPSKMFQNHFIMHFCPNLELVFLCRDGQQVEKDIPEWMELRIFAHMRKN